MLAFLIDITVICFDLLVFTQMIRLRRNTLPARALMYGGCAAIVAGYFFATYIKGVPSALASTICMSLPSLMLFFYLSEYKGARFFLTFCLVDTLTLILAFFARWITIVGGVTGGFITLALLLALCATAFVKGRPYFARYRELLEYGDAGWGTMTACAAIIYFGLIIFASYPAPLVERVEYLPSYGVFCLAVISCYMVFITSALKTHRIYRQNLQIQEAQKWHEMAYEDALTGCGNRMAYMEKINELERVRAADAQIGVMVFDMDSFKTVNDNLGHSVGDAVLKRASELLLDVFSEPAYSVFRIGGDEFAVICEGVCERELQSLLGALQLRIDARQSPVAFSMSVGYAFVDANENNAVEQAFTRADGMMYRCKRERKLIG